MLAVLLFPVPTLRFMCQDISEDSIKKIKYMCKKGKESKENWDLLTGRVEATPKAKYIFAQRKVLWEIYDHFKEIFPQMGCLQKNIYLF